MRLKLTLAVALAFVPLIEACSSQRSEQMEESVSYDDEGGGGAASDEPEEMVGATAVKEKRVVRGRLDIQVDGVEKAATRIKKHVKSTGGRVVNDELSGNGKKALRGRITARVATAKLDAFIAWLDKGYDIRFKQIRTQEAERLLTDAKVNLDVLEASMANLKKMADSPGIKLEQVLALEKEMRRLSTEIAQAKASKVFYEDQLAFATLDIALSREWDPILDRGPEPKLLVGARFARLVAPDSDAARGGLNGAGFSVGTPDGPYFGLDVDIFPKSEVGGRPVLVTIGGGVYSDYLGGGKRSYLNPWLGVRGGYGFLDEHAQFVLELELGCELVKLGYFSLNAFGRFASLTSKGGNLTGVESGVALLAPF